MDITWKVFSGEGEGKNGGKVQGIRSIIGRHKIGRGSEWYRKQRSRELKCTICGHELRAEGMLEDWGGAGQRRDKGEKLGKL